MLPLKKIVCPTDFSEPSMEALDVACEYAQHFDAELKVLHVIPFSPVFASTIEASAALNYLPSDEERRAQAQGQITNLIEERVPKDVRIVTELRMGDAPTEITSVAAEDNADLIVIGTHGETGWRFLAIGSVASKVVRMAHRPVLTTYGGPLPENAERSAK
ncbi:MAG: universal stress protein [Abditibacteriaceae bacterium]